MYAAHKEILEKSIGVVKKFTDFVNNEVRKEEERALYSKIQYNMEIVLGRNPDRIIATLDRPNLKLISGQDRLIAQADVKVLDFVDAYNPYGDGKNLTGNDSKITSNLEKVGINVEAIQGVYGQLTNKDHANNRDGNDGGGRPSLSRKSSSLYKKEKENGHFSSSPGVWRDQMHVTVCDTFVVFCYKKPRPEFNSIIYEILPHPHPFELTDFRTLHEYSSASKSNDKKSGQLSSPNSQQNSPGNSLKKKSSTNQAGIPNLCSATKSRSASPYKQINSLDEIVGDEEISIPNNNNTNNNNKFNADTDLVCRSFVEASYTRGNNIVKSTLTIRQRALRFISRYEKDEFLKKITEYKNPRFMSSSVSAATTTRNRNNPRRQKSNVRLTKSFQLESHHSRRQVGETLLNRSNRESINDHQKVENSQNLGSGRNSVFSAAVTTKEQPQLIFDRRNSTSTRVVI